MKCIECGHELKDGAVFCIRCGAMQVSKDDSAKAANKATVRPSVSNAQGAGGQHTTTAGKSFKPTPRRSTASIAVPIVAAVAVLAAVGALGMFVLNPGSSGSDSASQASATLTASSTSASSVSASSSSSSASSSSASKSSSASSSKSSASASASSSAAAAAGGNAASGNGSANNGNNGNANNGNNANANANANNGNNAGNAQAPAEQQQQQQQAPVAQDDSYYLGDTSSRYYSRAEVENMSNYDLYFARNEIFARHGRIFQNADLQNYFNSKSWYTPTYTPEQWNSMPTPLSDIEQKNSTLMLQVEQSRNSPYV